MNSRRILVAVAAFGLAVGAAAIGFALARLPEEAPTPTPSPTPSSSVAASCQMAVTPTSFTVDPDTGGSDDVLFLAGTGFNPGSGATIFLTETELMIEMSADGSFAQEVQAAVGVTHPAPPRIEAGPVTWVIGGEHPEIYACTAEVTVTIELTHAPSNAPPTDLSAGDYAEVLADGVRVRVAPSPNATVVGALYTGDIVHLLGPAQVADGYTWYLIETAVIQSGQPLRGYMAAGTGTQAWLRQTEAPPPPTPTPLPSPTASP